MPHTCIQVNPADNVAIAVRPLAPGELLLDGIPVQQPIPQGHKAALTNLHQGDAVIRYGVCIGYLRCDVPAGGYIGQHELEQAPPPALESLRWGTNLLSLKALPTPPVDTFDGYDCGNGTAGTRNLLGIITTVQCAAGVTERAAEFIRQNLLPHYPHVEDVVVLVPPYGCGVAIDAPEAVIPIRTIRNLIHHPNFGGQALIVSLGCEKLTPERVLDETEITDDDRVVLQDCKGYDGMIHAIAERAERKLALLEQRRRQPLPLSSLVIGLQCGGSDAFSGLTGNPAAGYAADMLVRAGATVMFSENSEVRDGAAFLAARTPDEQTCHRLCEELGWYDRYLSAGGVDRSANPTPGNKQGGLTNIVEKAMGSIAKSGHAPIVEVIATGARPTKHGMIYAATPANDMICGTSQMASGIGLQVFITGRGTPYNLRAIPVIKVGTRNDLYHQWPDLIDINAGTIASGEEDVAAVGLRLFHRVIDVASGRTQTCADRHQIYNGTYVFNPAPIT